MKYVADLTRAELRAAIDRAHVAWSKACDALIKAGRGHEVPSETLVKTDRLSLAFKRAADRSYALSTEREHRMRYHGSEHRVIRVY